MPVATAMPRLELEPVIERMRREAGAGCECSPDGVLWRLCIWGWFPPEWCGNLSLHCYAARLSVLAAEARRVRTSLWAGVFLLEPSPCGASPRAHDFVHMARHRPTGVAKPVAISIEDLRVEPGASGAARIHVGGPDRIGFLATVLDRMAFCSLYPHELSVRTTPDGRAEDRFLVQGVGGAPPTPAALEALERRLRG
ncbi:MAG TPA: hypothetical protein VMS55_24695 [Myxococcota bacterium]|nr:hypothetical protein [Myxococcota bacterium]